VEKDWNNAYVTRDGTLKPIGRPWTAQSLGGGTTFYAGIAFRYRHVDFDARAHAASDALDPQWPITYEDLRPYYDEIERRIGIARSNEGDSAAPPSAKPVMPPHPFSLPGSLLADAGRTIGLHPFPTPLAINSTYYQGRPPCMNLTPCNEYVCPSGARSDARSIFLEPLRNADSLVISQRSKAIRINLGSSDRVRSVDWLDLRNRSRRNTKVNFVILAANAIQSSALLLWSAQKWAPVGLGNRFDMVGKGLSFKVSGSVSSFVPAPRNRSNSGTGPHSTVAFSDYYVDSACPSGLGGQIYETSPEDRGTTRGRIQLRAHFIAGDQPMARNRLRLLRDVDKNGLQKLFIDYTTHPLDAERLHYLRKRASELLAAAGAFAIDVHASGYERGSRHLHGGCRAGLDPRTSVVDNFGRVHDLKNLYVVDGGFFPFAGGVNPTLTIQANALRISRELARCT
jgi:choline dehydrogenase-like flavoprotein